MDNQPVVGAALSTSANTAAAGSTSSDYYQLATTSNETAAATAAISNALKFATSKSIRTSTIILACFNALAAFTTAMGIIYGSYTYRKRMQRRPSDPSVLRYGSQSSSKLTPDRPSGLFFIPTIEVFPLVLSLAITIQSVTFAAAQSIGLQALLSSGCTLVAVFMLPAVFIVPFTHLVFGVETAFRGIRSQFAPRGKWGVGKCIGTLGVFTIAALVVASVDRAPDFCFASLYWFVKVYAPGSFGVLLSVSVILLVAVGIIFIKLSKSHMIDPTERMAASRMVYYLTLGVISNAFIIPFFFDLTFFSLKKVILETLNLAMVASVVSNVNGLMVAGLHLFLRSQTHSTIGHNHGDLERKRYSYDPREQNNFRGSEYSLQPVNTNSDTRSRSDSVATLLRAGDAEEGRVALQTTAPSFSQRSPFSPKLYIPSDPAYPEPTQPPSDTSPSQMRKQSYSIFPQDAPQGAPIVDALLPSTTYSPATSKPARDTWKPPPIVKPWAGRGHRRDSSSFSTATVQIGIRISNVDDFLPRKSNDTTRDYMPGFSFPKVPVSHFPGNRPSPPASVESKLESEYVPKYTGNASTQEQGSEAVSPVDPKTKTLPPMPWSPAVLNAQNGPEDKGKGKAAEPEEQLFTLSPAVYTPHDSLQRTPSQKQKLPSPKGVGFSAPITRNNSKSERSPSHAPPRPTGSAATTPMPSSKADWI